MTNMTENAKQPGPFRALLRTMVARLGSALERKPACSRPEVLEGTMGQAFGPGAASVYPERPPLPDSQAPEANPYVLAIGGALFDAGYRISPVDAGKVLDAVRRVHDITPYLTPEQARRREEAEKEAERLRQQLAAIAPALSEEAKNKAIREAAELIEAEAANVARGNATDGNWGDDHEPKAAHDEMLAKAAALRTFLPTGDAA
ncbi:MAG: hypothetical protein ACN6OP_03455 [Pseudomonadales bacterium]